MTDAPKADLQAQHSEDKNIATRLDGSSPSARSGLPQGKSVELSALTKQRLQALAQEWWGQDENGDCAHAKPEAEQRLLDDLWANDPVEYLTQFAIEAYRQGAREAIARCAQIAKKLINAEGEEFHQDCNSFDELAEKVAAALRASAIPSETFSDSGSGSANGDAAASVPNAEDSGQPWIFTDAWGRQWKCNPNGPGMIPAFTSGASAPDYTLAGSLAPTREGQEPTLPVVK